MTATRWISSLCLLFLFASVSQGSNLPEALSKVFENHCVDCHDGADAEGGLNLLSLDWNLTDPHLTGVWVKIHDRIASGEMPPKEASHLESAERSAAVKDLASRIIRFQEKSYVQHGRAVSRRVNRFEYENILRDLLHDPHLKIADQLPPDGEVHGFPKVGEALDVSHVQVDAYLDAAQFALRRAIEFPASRQTSTKRRYYAREQGRMWAGKGNPGWARFSSQTRRGPDGHSPRDPRAHQPPDRNLAFGLLRCGLLRLGCSAALLTPRSAAGARMRSSTWASTAPRSACPRTLSSPIIPRCALAPRG